MIQVFFRVFQVLCPIIFGNMKDAVSRSSHCFHQPIVARVSWRLTTTAFTTWVSSPVDNIPDKSFASLRLEKMGQQFHHHFVVGLLMLVIYCSVTVVTHVTAFSCFSSDLSFMKPPKSVRNMRAAWMVKTSGASGALWKPCQSWYAAADCAARYKKHRLHDENATSSQNWN